MFTVSEVLQRARLDQRIDLATVAARTKIKAKYLQAIEADDRKSLPGAFFYKSFVHQYATFLGVDTRAIDAEIDRVLSADAPLPLPRAAEQRAVKLSSRSGLRGHIFHMPVSSSYWWLALESMVGGTRAARLPRRKSRAAFRLLKTPRGGERPASPPGGLQSLPLPKLQPRLPRLRRLLLQRGRPSLRLVPESSLL